MNVPRTHCKDCTYFRLTFGTPIGSCCAEQPVRVTDESGVTELIRPLVHESRFCGQAVRRAA